MNPSAKGKLREQIHAALPQTQCTRCGYPDCAAYAEAIAAGDAAINQCPPGGAEGVARLAAITGLPALPLNPANGSAGPRLVAIIDEAWCIGCMLCIPVCPTDAIVGSNKMMHTVIEPWCTGCELCIPVCPVDCISLENISADRTCWQAWSAEDAATALTRYEYHSFRRPSDKGQSAKSLDKTVPGTPTHPAPHRVDAAESGQERKRSIIDAALARAKARSGGNTPDSKTPG